MDSIFVLGEDARAALLRYMMHSFGSAYICLWSYSPLPSNCLLFLDGFYDEEKIQQPSSSSGNLAASLFNAYCGSVNYIDNECVPGFAFKNNVPYLEVKLDYIQPAMLTTQTQMQFYQTAVFMGCAAGEIEVGFSSTQPQINLQMEIESWFPADFSTQTSLDSSSKNLPPSIFSDNNNNNNNNIPISSCFITVSSSSRSEANNILQETVAATSAVSSLTQIPEQQQFPAALIMPILSPLSSHHHTTTALNNPHRGAAFTRYRAPPPPLAAAHDHNRSRSFNARSLSLLRNLDVMRRSTLRHDESTMQNIQGNNHKQIHHVIAERKHRHKLNHSFQILRTLLLPQLFKKDKASVLSSTTKYLSSLRSQMGELERRNAILEMQLSSRAQRSELQIHPSTETRVAISVEIGPSSTSSSLVLDLRVSLRSRECSLRELVAQILGFLKHHYTNHVTLLSLQSTTTTVESTPLHALLLTLKIEGDGFDESGFQEAVRRIVDDLPH